MIQITPNSIAQRADRLLLAPNFSVDYQFCNTIAQQVEEIIPALIPDVLYTLEHLCGEQFWGHLSDGECRTAGRCMVWLVTNNRLPLCIADTRHEYPVYYRLK